MTEPIESHCLLTGSLGRDTFEPRRETWRRAIQSLEGSQAVAKALVNGVGGRGGVAGTGCTGPRLLDRMREAFRYCHYGCRTEQTYCDWISRC